MTFWRRIRYVVTEPYAWWFSTSTATALLGAALAAFHLGALAAIVSIVTSMNLVGLYMGRGNLHFIYVKARHIEEMERLELKDQIRDEYGV